MGAVARDTGGGLSGVGIGIALDPTGNVWVGNFGFASRNCADPPPSDSVSKLAADGTPISHPEGYRSGMDSWPQGTVSDREGTIWIANCGNDTVTRADDPVGHHRRRRRQRVGGEPQQPARVVLVRHAHVALPTGRAHRRADRLAEPIRTPLIGPPRRP